MAREFAFSCSACGLPDGGLDVKGMSEFIFMIMLQDFMDPWTFNQKNLMKCCKEFLLPGGKQIPFCAYNTVGYREQARTQLVRQEKQRQAARRAGTKYEVQPVTFSFGKDNPSDELVQLNDPPAESAELKSCCAALYQSDFARMLLGDSFHPGGLRLTARLGEHLGFGPGLRVLDVASGKGESAIFLARQFGCQVVGVDFGPENVKEANPGRGGAGCSPRLIRRRRCRAPGFSGRRLRRGHLRVRILHFSRQARGGVRVCARSAAGRPSRA